MIEPSASREIHDIRERIYSETRGLGLTERTARVRANSQKIIDNYGLRIKTIAYSGRN